jgi:hypothetical protein
MSLKAEPTEKQRYAANKLGLTDEDLRNLSPLELIKKAVADASALSSRSEAATALSDLFGRRTGNPLLAMKTELDKMDQTPIVPAGMIAELNRIKADMRELTRFATSTIGPLIAILYEFFYTLAKITNFFWDALATITAIIAHPTLAKSLVTNFGKEMENFPAEIQKRWSDLFRKRSETKEEESLDISNPRMAKMETHADVFAKMGGFGGISTDWQIRSSLQIIAQATVQTAKNTTPKTAAPMPSSNHLNSTSVVSQQGQSGLFYQYQR